MPLLTDPFRLVFLVLSLVMVVARAYYQVKHRAVAVALTRQSFADSCLLAVLFVLVVPPPALYVFTTWLSFADYARADWLGWIGVPLMATGTWLFWRSHADLRANWTGLLEIRQGHALITTGAYGRIRHPQYMGVMLAGVGQALLLNNWIAGPSNVLAALLIMLVRVPAEERLMEDAFDDEYRRYAARTRRFVPGRRNLRKPKEV